MTSGLGKVWLSRNIFSTAVVQGYESQNNCDAWNKFSEYAFLILLINHACRYIALLAIIILWLFSHKFCSLKCFFLSLGWLTCMFRRIYCCTSSKYMKHIATTNNDSIIVYQHNLCSHGVFSFIILFPNTNNQTKNWVCSVGTEVAPNFRNFANHRINVKNSSPHSVSGGRPLAPNGVSASNNGWKKGSKRHKKSMKRNWKGEWEICKKIIKQADGKTEEQPANPQLETLL